MAHIEDRDTRIETMEITLKLHEEVGKLDISKADKNKLYQHLGDFSEKMRGSAKNGR